MSTIAMPVKFDYEVVSIKDLTVIDSKEAHKHNRVNLPVRVGDRDLKSTPRFWNSLYSRYGFNGQFNKYFSHEEIFSRIHAVEKNDKIRLCVEQVGADEPRLLAVSNPTKPVAHYAEVMELLGEYDGENLAYANGELTSLHAPRIGGSQPIVGDLFHNRFAVSVPVDGYGQTSLYLALLRQVCMNGAVAMSKAFRSSLSLGKGDDSVLPTLTRALDSFNNDEGFHALRQRIESSAKSWASVHEALSLYKNLIKMHLADELTSDGAVKAIDGVVLDERYAAGGWDTPILSKFHALTGDTSMLYGLANMEALSPKRQKTLPVKCTVYDLINFATEVSSHHSNANGQRRLGGWFGTTVSNEYDMEGTMDSFGDFADFHVTRKLTSGVTGSDFDPSQN